MRNGIKSSSYDIKPVVLVSNAEGGFEAAGYCGSSSYKGRPKSFFPIKFYSFSVSALPFLSGSDIELQCELDISQE